MQLPCLPPEPAPPQTPAQSPLLLAYFGIWRTGRGRLPTVKQLNPRLPREVTCWPFGLSFLRDPVEGSQWLSGVLCRQQWVWVIKGQPAWTQTAEPLGRTSTARAWLVCKDMVAALLEVPKLRVSDRPGCLSAFMRPGCICQVHGQKRSHRVPRRCWESDGQPDSMAGAWVGGDTGLAGAERLGVEPPRSAVWWRQDFILGQRMPVRRLINDRVRTSSGGGGSRAG